MIITTYGFSIMTPSLNSLISLKVSSENQGEIMGISRAISTLARVMGPAFSGVLFSLQGKDAPFFGGAAVLFFIIIIITITLPRFKT